MCTQPMCGMTLAMKHPMAFNNEVFIGEQGIPVHRGVPKAVVQ
jgi:hypothetical protein